jgi:hypothetical protein
MTRNKKNKQSEEKENETEMDKRFVYFFRFPSLNEEKCERSTRSGGSTREGRMNKKFFATSCKCSRTHTQMDTVTALMMVTANSVHAPSRPMRLDIVFSFSFCKDQSVKSESQSE